MADSSDKQSATEDADQSERRNFVVAALAAVVGTITGLFGFIIGTVVFLDPLSRKKKIPLFYRDEESSNDGYVQVANTSAIPKNGTPVRFPVIMDVVDAWTFSPDQPVGAVYIRQDKKGSLTVFHATCPHAGCAVSQTAKGFHCPCHNSSFGFNGDKVDLPGKENPSPRSMDELKHQVDGNGNILVKFENYYTGIHEKKPKI